MANKYLPFDHPINVRMRELWKEGYSGGYIARVLNDQHAEANLTARAVIGRVYRWRSRGKFDYVKERPIPRDLPLGNERNGYKARFDSVNKLKILKKKREQKARVKVQALTSPTIVECNTNEVISKDDVNQLDLTNAVKFEDLQRNQCKYPIGEPGTDEFRMCGARAIAGKNYCQKHYAMCIEPRKRKLKKKASLAK